MGRAGCVHPARRHAFFARLALVEPSPRQYETLVRSLLVSKVAYGGRVRVRLPPNDTLPDLRRSTAQGAERLLKLGSLGCKSGEGSQIDVEMLLAPFEAGGGGMPDVRTELLAEIAVDTITMLHSPRAVVREAALLTGERRREILAALHAETGFTMHVHRPAAEAARPRDGDPGSSAVQLLPSLPTWAAHCQAPSGPGRNGDAFLAEAPLIVQPKDLLFRALRQNEIVVHGDGTVRLRDGVRAHAEG